jgi:hypothetical protein
VRLALKVVIQNDGDFVDVILLYMATRCHNKSRATSSEGDVSVLQLNLKISAL